MIQKSVLDNGIRIVTEKIPALRSAAIGVWIETGSRHESPRLGGISHFVEHMLFKGTQTRSSQQIARQIDAVGGVLNGFTGREYTCFYAKVLGEKLPMAVELLADILCNPRFDSAEIEKERRVILQEIGMVEDTPDELVYELFSRTFWGDHPLGRPVLGSRASIETLQRRDFVEFVRDRYTGERIIVSAAGAVDHHALVEMLNRAFGTIPASASEPIAPPPLYRRQLSVVEKDLEQVHICLGTRLLPQNHPGRYTAYLFNMILGGGMSSRLFQRIREELGLAYSVYSSVDAHTDAGSLVIYAGIAPGETEQVVNALLDELARFRREPVSAEELAVAKDQLQGNILLSLENSEASMSLLARNEIYLGRIFPVREMQRGIEKVTIEDIRQLADEVLRDESLTLQILGRVRPGELGAGGFSLQERIERP